MVQVRIDRIVTQLICLFILMAGLFGCSSTKNDFLRKSEAERIKNIAIVTSLREDEPQVYDKTSPNRRPIIVGASPVGIIVGLTASATVNAINKAFRKSRSLGGDADGLIQGLKGFPAEEIFNSNFGEEFGKTVRSIHPNQTEAMKSGFTRTGDGTMDYSSLRRNFGADTVLVIDFHYGLAVYDKAKPSAAIGADVSLVSIEEKRVILSRSVFCDTPYLGGHTLEEYEADNGRLFKEEIGEAARSCARLMIVYVAMPLEDS